MIHAATLKNSLSTDDKLFLVHVNAVSDADAVTDCGAQSIAKDVQRLVTDKYSDVFPADLPAQLPPERGVHHTILCDMALCRITACLHTAHTGREICKTKSAGCSV